MNHARRRAAIALNRSGCTAAFTGDVESLGLAALTLQDRIGFDSKLLLELRARPDKARNPETTVLCAICCACDLLRTSIRTSHACDI
jgi:hypothetical protein